MRKIAIIFITLFAGSAAAVEIDNGSQWSFASELAQKAYSAGVWTLTDTRGNEFKVDDTTLFKFRGTKKVKSMADVKPGAVLNVFWCVGHEGACDTRASVLSLYGFDAAEIDRTIEVTSLR